MSEFTQRCYEALKMVPKGKVTTYQEIAKFLGSKAYRGVGAAMRANPNAPQVPCHRVVRSDGAISGYRFGVDKKVALLREKGIEVEDGKVKHFEDVKFHF